MEIIIQDNGRGTATTYRWRISSHYLHQLQDKRLNVLFLGINSSVKTEASDNGFRVEINIPILTED